MFNKRLITALVVGGLMFLMLASGSALAAKGTSGAGGGHHTTTPTGTLTVSPNPSPPGNVTITVNGSGFGANQALTVGVLAYLSSQSVTTDSTGNFSVAITDYFGGPSWYTVQAGNWTSKGFVVLASTTFTTCSTNPC
jgi:hypothetical protein